MAQQFVQLNVGGVPHTTARETLMREPSSRLALMARGILPCPTGADGAMFIDRSPRFFQIILNYLRDGWVLLPKTADERRELLQEIRRAGAELVQAGYYQLTGFEAWLRAQEIASPAPLDRSPSPAASTAYSGYSGSPSYSTAFGGYGSLSMVAGPPPPLSAVTRASIWDPAGGALGGAGESLAAPCRSSVFVGEAAVGRSSFVPPLPGHGPAYSSVGVLSATAPVRASSMYHASLPMPPAPTNSLVRAASASAAQPELGAAKFVPQPLDPGAFRWTSKYLQGNDRMRDVVTTLLELAFMPPHRALHTGKVSITIASECTHDRMTALLGSTMSEGSSLRDKLQVISVKGSSGWAFEMALRPGSELALFEKYSVAEYVQDNWFVLAAILKDEYDIRIEEDTTNRPTCAACRRSNVSLTLERHF